MTPLLLNEAFVAKIMIKNFFPSRGEHIRTYISESKCAWWQKTIYEQTHIHTHETTGIIIKRNALRVYKQICNGEYTKYFTRGRHQLKMAAPDEVSKKRSNFRIRQF